MRRALPALLLLLALSLPGCRGDADQAGPAPTDEPAAEYSEQVRDSFRESCIDNATNTSNGAATEEQIAQTCDCILGKVEEEYSEADFAEFEKRLLGGQASDQESARLVEWSTACAREAAAG